VKQKHLMMVASPYADNQGAEVGIRKGDEPELTWHQAAQPEAIDPYRIRPSLGRGLVLTSCTI
jgi:hypothetical protein